MPNRSEIESLNAIRQEQREEIAKLRTRVEVAEAKASDTASPNGKKEGDVENDASVNTQEYNQALGRQLDESRCRVQQLNSALEALREKLTAKEKALV